MYKQLLNHGSCALELHATALSTTLDRLCVKLRAFSSRTIPQQRSDNESLDDFITDTDVSILKPSFSTKPIKSKHSRSPQIKVRQSESETVASTFTKLSANKSAVNVGEDVKEASLGGFESNFDAHSKRVTRRILEQGRVVDADLLVRSNIFRWHF